MTVAKEVLYATASLVRGASRGVYLIWHAKSSGSMDIVETHHSQVPTECLVRVSHPCCGRKPLLFPRLRSPAPFMGARADVLQPGGGGAQRGAGACGEQGVPPLPRDQGQGGLLPLQDDRRWPAVLLQGALPHVLSSTHAGEAPQQSPSPQGPHHPKTHVAMGGVRFCIVSHGVVAGTAGAACSLTI